MRPDALTCCLGALMLGLTGCATVSVTAGSIRSPEPIFAYNAIEAEGTPPGEIAVSDFEFAPSAVIENRSLFHRAIDLFRSSSSRERRIAIGSRVAAALSEQTAKRLGKTGLPVQRIPAGSDVALSGNILLVTGRLNYIDEGNRFTRILVGLGMGESRLTTDVHVFRVVHNERAEVLAFTTKADSGKMPGIGGSIATLGLGGLVLGPALMIKAAKDAASGGMKLYESQVNYLARETGAQIAAYLSQYAAAQHWITQNKAQRVRLAG